MIYHGITMALNLKNAQVERLATEVARLTGESKTEAIRRRARGTPRRLKRPSVAERRARLLRFLSQRSGRPFPRRPSAAA